MSCSPPTLDPSFNVDDVLHSTAGTEGDGDTDGVSDGVGDDDTDGAGDGDSDGDGDGQSGKSPSHSKSVAHVIVVVTAASSLQVNVMLDPAGTPAPTQSCMHSSCTHMATTADGAVVLPTQHVPVSAYPAPSTAPNDSKPYSCTTSVNLPGGHVQLVVLGTSTGSIKYRRSVKFCPVSLDKNLTRDPATLVPAGRHGNANASASDLPKMESCGSRNRKRPLTSFTRSWRSGRNRATSMRQNVSVITVSPAAGNPLYTRNQLLRAVMDDTVVTARMAGAC